MYVEVSTNRKKIKHEIFRHRRYFLDLGFRFLPDLDREAGLLSEDEDVLPLLVPLCDFGVETTSLTPADDAEVGDLVFSTNGGDLAGFSSTGLLSTGVSAATGSIVCGAVMLLCS